MEEPRFCPVESSTEAAFDAADHEDLHDGGHENIELYDCPACGGRHRYHNGRFTIAPLTIQCGVSECDEPAASEHTRGLSGYCSREHRVLARRRGEALLAGEDPQDVTVGDLSESSRWSPGRMQRRINELAADSQ